MILSLPVLISLLFNYVSSANLLSNPSFELLNSQGWATSWTDEKHNCKIVNDTAHTGTHSLHCAGGNAGVYQLRWNVFFGVKYRLTAYIKTRNITTGRVLFCAESSNYKYGCYIYHDSIPECKDGTCDDQWYKMTCNSLMNFEKSGHYVVVAELRPSSAVGEFWLDDVSMEMVENNVLLAVEVVTWRQEIFEDPVDVLVDLDVIDSVFFNGDYLIITVDIEDEETGEVKQTLTEFHMETREDNRVAVFSWNPSSLEKNKFYVVRARTINTLFSNRTETTYTTVKKLSEKREYKFYVDKYLKAWENGKKFFPLGLFVGEMRDSDLDLFKDSPFNLIKLPGANKATMDKVYNRTNGQVRVINNIVGVPLYYHSKLTDEEKTNIRTAIKKNIDSWKDSPGFFGYYIADEPGTSLISSLREVTLTIREYDQDHVTWPAINNRLYLRQYKEMFDVVGIDCYPLQYYDDLHAIWIMAIQSRERMINNRAMWNIPQIFDWELYNNNTKETPPTEEQLRQMTYQWIVGGTNGIIYFDYSEMRAMDWKNPFEKEWEKVKKVATELKEKYAPIIMSSIPTNPGYVLPKFDRVSGYNYFGRRLFRYDGYDYLLIVNVRKTNNYKITFTKPNTTTSLEMIMGTSTMSIVNNTVTIVLKSADTVWLKGYDTEWNPADPDEVKTDQFIPTSAKIVSVNQSQYLKYSLIVSLLSFLLL